MENEIYLVVKDIELPHFSTDSNDEAIVKFYDIGLGSIPDKVLDYKASYWSLIDNRAGYILANYNGFGIVDSDDSDYYLDDNLWTRPVLIVDQLDKLNLPLYTELEIFDKKWIYIGNNRCFSVKAIQRISFDYDDSYKYETSNIKRELDNWLKK